MSIRLTILMLLGSTRLLPGQVDINFVDFRKLTQFDSVVIKNETGKEEYVFIYENRALKKKKYYYDGELTYYIDYRFDANSSSSVFRHWSTVYPGEGEPYKEWGDYKINIDKIKNGRVTEKASLRSNGQDSTLQNHVLLIYNPKGLLAEERIFDHTTGLKNVFKSNSCDFDSAYEKKNVEERIKKYRYDENKLVIEYLIRDELKGREFIEFNKQGRPTSITSTDNQDQKLGETIIDYDTTGKIVERKIAWYIGKTLWDESADFTLPVTEKIYYNTKGLPNKVISQFKGQKPETSIYMYY